MAKRDFAKFQTFIAEDAIFLAGSKPLRGRKAIADAWKSYFDPNEPAPFSWHPDQVTALGSQPLALSSGPVRAANGMLIGRFNSVWQKQKDGEWRVIFDKGETVCSESECELD